MVFIILSHMIHWWKQFLTLVMQEDLEHFYHFFQLFVVIFLYVYNLIYKKLNKNLTLRLVNITWQLISMLKQVAIVLKRLQIKITHDFVDNFFDMDDFTSMKVCKQ